MPASRFSPSCQGGCSNGLEAKLNNVLTNVLGMLLAGSATVMTVDYGGDVLRSAGDRAVAASSIATASQIASAVKLYALQEGAAYEGSSLRGLIDADYLDGMPANPAKAGDPFLAMGPDGRRVAAVPLGASGAEVCRMAAKAADGERLGCMEAANGSYAVFARI